VNAQPTPKPSKWLRCRKCSCLTLRALADSVPGRRGLCAGCGFDAEPVDLQAEHEQRKRQAGIRDGRALAAGDA
jgi:hypothetical protein